MFECNKVVNRSVYSDYYFYLMLRERVHYLQVVFIFHVIVPMRININQKSSNVLISVWDQQLFPRSSDMQDSVSHKSDRQSQLYPVSCYDIVTLHMPTRDYDNKRIVLGFREIMSLSKHLCNCPPSHSVNHSGIKLQSLSDEFCGGVQ